MWETGPDLQEFHLHRVQNCGFHGNSTGKESPCDVGDLGLIHRLGRSSGEGNPTHYSVLAWTVPCSVWSMRLQRVHRTERFSFHFHCSPVASTPAEGGQYPVWPAEGMMICTLTPCPGLRPAGALWHADSGLVTSQENFQTSTNLYRAFTGLAVFLGWQ